MLITAHGGSFKTGRNSQKYFDVIQNYNVDIIEVDIQRHGKLLYLSHLPSFAPEKHCLTLRYAFEFIKKHDFLINCDVKRGGMVKAVVELAQDVGVEDRIIFTGSVRPYEIKDVTVGAVYLNKTFFPMLPTPENVGRMKAHIERFNNPRIAGINLKYTYLTDNFLCRCAESELAVSAFTVDNEVEQKRLVNYPIIVNLTSNMPNCTLQLLHRPVEKPKTKTPKKKGATE